MRRAPWNAAWVAGKMVSEQCSIAITSGGLLNGGDGATFDAHRPEERDRIVRERMTVPPGRLARPRL